MHYCTIPIVRLLRCSRGNSTSSKLLNLGRSATSYARPLWDTSVTSRQNSTLRYGNQLNILVAAGLHLIPLYSVWGLQPNQNSSHIQIKYIQGVWEASYAVDGHMSFHYHGFCPIRFWESAQFMGHSWPSFDTIIQCLRLSTQPEVIPHSNPTYTR